MIWGFIGLFVASRTG